LKGFRNCF